MVKLPNVDSVTCTEAVGRLLWCGHDDGSVSVREPRSGVVVEVRQFRNTDKPHYPSCLICVDEHMWIGYSDGRVLIVDTQTLTSIGHTNAHVDRVNDIVHHSGWIFTASDDTFIHKFSVDEDGKPYKESSLAGHTAPVKALCCAGDVLVSAALDQTAIIWSLSGTVVFSLSFMITKAQGYSSIKEKLHDLADKITDLHLSEGSRHYHHLLPDIMTVPGPMSPTRQNYRKAALQSQKRRLVGTPKGKPPLPGTPKSGKTITKPMPKVDRQVRETTETNKVVRQPVARKKQPPKPTAQRAKIKNPKKPMSMPVPISVPLPLGRLGRDVSPPVLMMGNPELIMQPLSPESPYPQAHAQVQAQGYSMNLRTNPTDRDVVVNVDDEDSTSTYGRAVRSVKRGRDTSWMLQFRTEVRLARVAFKKWKQITHTKRRGSLYELAELMEGVSNAGVITGYYCKWKEWLGIPKGNVDSHEEAEVEVEEEVILPEREEGDDRLCLVVDVGCLVDLEDGMTPYSNIVDFFNTCHEYCCELIVWLPDANEDLIVTLRRYDTMHVVSHCIIRENPAATPTINRPYSRLLFIQPITNPNPAIRNTVCVYPSSLRMISTLLVSIHQSPIPDVPHTLQAVLQRTPDPVHILM